MRVFRSVPVVSYVSSVAPGRSEICWPSSEKFDSKLMSNSAVGMKRSPAPIRQNPPAVGDKVDVFLQKTTGYAKGW